MAQHLNENSLLSNTHDKCEDQLISCFSSLSRSLSRSLSLSLCSQLRDEELSKESQESNWFSAPSALRVYGEKTSVWGCQVSNLTSDVHDVR